MPTFPQSLKPAYLLALDRTTKSYPTQNNYEISSRAKRGCERVVP